MIRRRWVLLIVAIIAALILFFPLRLAIGLASDGDSGISARNISGTIWDGLAEEVQIGALGLGSLDIDMDPLALMTARLSLRFTRTQGAGEPLSGAAILGLGWRGLEGVSGTIHGPAKDDTAIETVTLNDFSASFADGRCSEAGGRVQVNIALPVAGLNLRHGLSGEATCRGGALFLPLVGESGMERINVSVTQDGRYTAQLSIRATDPILATALVAAGLAATSDGFGMTMRGQF